MPDLEPYNPHPTPESHNSPYRAPAPYWRRAHRDWKFWVAVIAIFSALWIYIVSFDLVLVPRV